MKTTTIERTAGSPVVGSDSKQAEQVALLTRYGVHSAITRASADFEAYDRASEFERIGGDVIELSPAQWREVVAA